MKANHNLPEFKKLIERYETITIKDIQNENCSKRELTGFGTNDTCTLCRAVKYEYDKFRECKKCVWHSSINKSEWKEDGEGVPCNIQKNQDTFDAINRSFTAQDILSAFRARAAHMRSILKKLNLE